VRSRLRSEQDAFRFLVIAAAGVVAALATAVSGGPAWLTVWLLVLAVAVAVASAFRRRGRELPLRSAPSRPAAADGRRILVVANDTLTEETFTDELGRLASEPGARVHVLAPVLLTPRGRWLGGGDAPRAEAGRRLEQAFGRISADAEVTAEVSPADPLQAIEDALATFVPDEIVVSTLGNPLSDGLEPRLARLAQERFAVPVAHFVVDAS
jgi:GABA permease